MSGFDAEAVAIALDMSARADDALERFIDSLPEAIVPHARETVRLRSELADHAAKMLSADTGEAMAHAEWVTRHARDVTYRWGVLRGAFLRWSLRSAKAAAFLWPR